MGESLSVKVCGMREPQNISEIVSCRPDLIGFIFSRTSKRFVGDDFDPKIVKEIPATVRKVGVFVDSEIEAVQKTVGQYGLDMVQLHGHESTGYCGELKELLSQVGIIKSFTIRDNFNWDELKPYEPSVSLFLFDNGGGSGVRFNWKTLESYPLSTNFMLAGGISSYDTEEILNLKSKNDYLFGVDINSRFESSPAIKSCPQVKQFISEIKG